MYWQSLSNYLVNFSPPGLTQFFLGFVLSEHVHGVGSNQFLSVNIGVIRLLSVITTTPFGNYGTSETMFDQKR
jgi:hypothetical protein